MITKTKSKCDNKIEIEKKLIEIRNSKRIQIQWNTFDIYELFFP
jgi:hypothetical protein